MTRARIIPMAVVGALLGLNWYLAQRSIEISPIAPADAPAETSRSTATPQDAETPSGDTNAGDPARNDLAFQERPLFSPTRRPHEPKSTGATASGTTAIEDVTDPRAAAESSGLRLIGVMQIGGSERRALIRTVNATNGVWLPLGGEVDGWRVSSIEPETVVIAKSGGSEHLILRRRTAGDTR